MLYEELKEQLAQATVPVAGVIPVGTPLGIVEIPHLGLEQVFLQGSASEQTMTGPGYSPTPCCPDRPASPSWSAAGPRSARRSRTSTSSRSVTGSW